MESLTQENNLNDAQTLRVIDANLNRLREGIRVVEDILRYGFDNKDFALALKNMRHKCKIKDYLLLVSERDSVKDVLKESTTEEQKREDLKQILIANFKRSQESARVLEELLKLDCIQESEKFKTIRYELYNLEKQVLLGVLE